jgi:threonylcarbamoyladenosine tRNA methylthiotransferase MtaB
MKITIKTLGCRANRYESDKIREKFLDKAEFVDEHEKADICIVNTCTVTSIADRKSRQAVNALRNISPKAKVIVFGCGPRIDPEKFRSEGIDFVATKREQVEKYLETHLKKFTKAKSPISSRTRANIKIQDGCRNFCTYCIIAHARGPEVSYPITRIMKEIKLKEKQGFKEIVLTGIHIGSFRRGKIDLADLIWKILEETSIPRVRLSSIEPQNFSAKFLKLFKNPRFCKHLHISLQSGCDKTLKRMNRRYDSKKYEEVCKRLFKACPDLAITTDVITGFPGETEQDHKKSMTFAKKIGFAKLHVFPFSPRPKTPAYSMSGQLPNNIKLERAKEFRKIGAELRKGFIKSQLGKENDVLFEETRDNKTFTGLTTNYIKVKMPGKNLTNKIQKVRLGSKGQAVS